MASYSGYARNPSVTESVTETDLTTKGMVFNGKISQNVN